MNWSIRQCPSLLLLLALGALPALAAVGVDTPAATVVAEDTWVRVVPPSQTTTAGFMTLVNQGAEARRLVDAQSPRAKTIELHEMAHEGDRMRMRRVDHIVVGAGERVELRPGGLHLMLFGLTAPLSPGERVPITLVFDDGSTIDVEADARMPQGHQ